MSTPTTSRTYGFGTVLSCPPAEALERAKAALKEQGFGVLTEIDVAATLRQKLGVESRPYTILGACNPALAHRALSADLGVGLLLPCNVVVYATHEGGSAVEFMGPRAAMGIVGDDPAVAAVAAEARARLQAALAALEAAG
jgi:uncharacterized protein (DUF302 family)